MTVYASPTTDDAQRIIDSHPVCSGTGRCLRCDVPGPCWYRESALMVFRTSGTLPRRWPGASRPELIGARRLS